MSDLPLSLIGNLRCGSCGAPATQALILDGMTVPVCMRHLNHWRSPDFEPATADREGPDDGHTFRLVFDIRGSHLVVGDDGPHDGPEFMGPAHVIEVRAWNLHDALVKASGLPFAVMMGDMWSRDPLTRPEEPEHVED